MVRGDGQRLPERQQERLLIGGAVLAESQCQAGDAGAGEGDLRGTAAVRKPDGRTGKLVSKSKLCGVSALADGLQIQARLAGEPLRQLLQQDAAPKRGFRCSGVLLLSGDLRRGLCAAAVDDAPVRLDVEGSGLSPPL